MTHRWVAAVMTLCLAVSALGQVAPRVAQPAVATAPTDAVSTPVVFPKPPLRAAIVPDSGLVAMVTLHEGVVKLYPDLASQASLANAVELKVGQYPCDVRFKKVKDKSYLLVGCYGNSSLYVIDAKTREIVKQLPLKNNQVTGLAVPSDARVPYVYYSSASQNCKVGRVNLENWTEDPVALEGYIGTDSPEVAVSAEGQWLYARHPSNTPSGLRVYRVQEETPKGPRTLLRRSHHTGANPYCVDEFGALVGADNMIYTAELGPAPESGRIGLAQVPGIMRSFIPGRAMAASLENETLWILSTNTFTPLLRVALGKPTRQSSPPWQPAVTLDNRYWKFSPTVLYDAKDDNLLVVNQDYALVVKLKSLNLPKEPNLFVSLTGNRDLVTTQSAN